MFVTLVFASTPRKIWTSARSSRRSFGEHHRLICEPAGLAATVWRAAVEFQFYLVAPFVFMFVGRNGLKYLLGTALLFWLLRMIVLLPPTTKLELYQISYFTIVGRINQFLAGIGLAYAFHTGILKLREHRGRAAFGLAICSFLFWRQ